ncbi:MAG: methyltransferase domain-containing protein [Nitrospirae bacterium]|nr:methyltransferase domain-containing protein [Nitrospirota bacterium]
MKKIIEPVSLSSTLNIVETTPELKQIWEYSKKLFPSFSEHFSFPIDNKENEHRLRLLITAEVYFTKMAIEPIIKTRDVCSYADIGDCDGSVRVILKEFFYGDKLKSVGVNLQQDAVKKIIARGLDAICADALDIHNQAKTYDLISVFETLEHLPDPIGFLKNIRQTTNSTLIISVPYIRKSRVSLRYLTSRWPKKTKPTIENTHIFELSPMDWKKIFLHTGWKVEKEYKLLAFKPFTPHRLILEPYWRYASFEGFWFVALGKTDQYSSLYSIE